MSSYKWIKDHGIIRKEDLIGKLKQYIKADRYFLAYCTDKFYAGQAEADLLEEIEADNVLEIRIFSKTEEIYFVRSSVGADFQWRIASEDGLNNSEYIVRYQTLDINRERVTASGNQKDFHGNKILYTTVGGKYSLPVEEEDSSEIIAYVEYDKNGMAKIVDYRICGFVKRLEKGKGM